MTTFLARLTAFDWLRIVGYIITALTFVGGQAVLTTWGMSAADATLWSQRIATIVGFLTLVSNVLKNPSPPSGTMPVLTTQPANPTPDTLTTSVAQTAPPTKGPS